VIDPQRLARAVHLEVEVCGAARWIVSGGKQVHTVTGAECDCQDSALRPGAVCKHRLAVQLARLPAEMREALRLVAPAKAAGRQVRRRDRA
jgi:hypothetical protein